MAYTIAVAGKGGTGKTAISSLIVAQLISNGKTPILAIDADPNSNLNERLGVEPGTTLGDLEAEVLTNKASVSAGMDKHRYVEYQLQTALMEQNGFDLLVMGRTEGPGCYCSINNILRDFVDKLGPNYEYVVIDNEAGMEHLSRRTTRNVDLLLFVSDVTPLGVRSVGRIHNMVRNLEIDIAESYLILSRANGEIPHQVLKEVEKIDLKLISTIPDDKTITEYCLDEKSMLLLPDNSPSRMGIQELLEKAGVV